MDPPRSRKSRKGEKASSRPFYATDGPTSANIVSEARSSLRSLDTKRPFTPVESNRTLFGGSSSKPYEGRPPSAFRYRHLNILWQAFNYCLLLFAKCQQKLLKFDYCHVYYQHCKAQGLLSYFDNTIWFLQQSILVMDTWHELNYFNLAPHYCWGDVKSYALCPLAQNYFYLPANLLYSFFFRIILFLWYENFCTHGVCVVNEHVHIVDWMCGDVLMICKSIPNEIVSIILLGFLKSLWKCLKPIL